ncbi:MAG: hypothetical protein SPG48_09630 [Treponema sp.]|nr:hypothetical protein [Treponema sp.]
MNDLGSSWYINSDVDSVEVFKITEDMITAKILKNIIRIYHFVIYEEKI